jgi:hypothetical protein
VPVDVKFMLLHAPISNSTTMSGARNATSSVAANPTSPATEEAIRQFFSEVYESWVKTCMSPFYTVDMEVKNPIFRSRVAAAGKKYL